MTRHPRGRRLPAGEVAARLAGGCLLVFVLTVAAAVALVYLRLHSAEREAHRRLKAHVAEMRDELTRALTDGTLTPKEIAVVARQNQAEGLIVRDLPGMLRIETRQSGQTAGPWVGGTSDTACFSYVFTKPLAPGRQPKVSELSSCPEGIHRHSPYEYLQESAGPVR